MRTSSFLLSLAVALGLLPACRGPEAPEAGPVLAAGPATFVGSASCKSCHELAYRLWEGSDHDLAMAEATEETVLGDFDDAVFDDGRVTTRFYRREGKFFVHTEGPGGEMAEFEITHTFGYDPLQQYLVPFPGGRMQALNVTWDAEKGEWYRQYAGQEILADDWLHWTRNGQNWNGMCAECHSTNLIKGYDPESDSYETTWSEIDVGCEACHGPGSRHLEWVALEQPRPALAAAGFDVSTREASSRRIVELCAPCHARRSELGDYDHTQGEPLDYMVPALLREGLYEPDGQILDEVYVYGSFLQSVMYDEGVSCVDCHDSHSLQLHREGNELCLGCHERESFDTEAHHFHEPGSTGAECVKCHMVERPYMGIDWRADHSFRVPRPDLSAELGIRNACNESGCHDTRTPEWAAERYREWYGETERPHFAAALAAAWAGDPAAGGELSRVARDAEQRALVRATALELVSGTPEGEAALRSALTADDPLLRHTAVTHLSLRTPEDVQAILPLLSDPVRAVRIAAVGRVAGVPREMMTPVQASALERGVAEYRASAAHSLDFSASAMRLANLEYALGNLPEAERHYRGALAVDELFYPAKLNLAVLLSARGEQREAETLVREVREAFPENGEAAYSLGLLLVEEGKLDEALTVLEQAAELSPQNPRVFYNLGLLLQQVGRVDEAERRLRRALELEPDGLDFMHAYADHLMRAGRREEALALADRMIALYPNAPAGHGLRQMLAAP